MIDIECPHEEDVAAAVAVGSWPGGCDTKLTEHAASCAICADIVVVAAAFRADAHRACAEARVPAAGLVWWRARLRAVHEEAESAGRPIGYLHALAGAVAAGLFLALGGLLWPVLRGSFDLTDVAGGIVDMGRLWVPLGIAVGAWLVLAPVLMWLVLSEDHD
jgi:hypothetical protein